MKLFLASLLLCGALLGKAEPVNFKVLNLDGSPLAGATLRTTLTANRSDKNVVLSGVTDGLGKASFDSKSFTGLNLKVTKPNHYDTQLLNLGVRDCQNKAVYLPARINPVALYAKHVSGLSFPLHKEWIGFDFERGDWIAPYGKGKVEDIRFKYERRLKGYPPQFDLETEIMLSQENFKTRKLEWSRQVFDVNHGLWECQLSVSFPNAGEGLVEEVDRYLSYSDLRLPHQAPEGPYVSSFDHTLESFQSYRDYAAKREKTGYFLRTRVVKDSEQRIIYAQYAKIYGGFDFAKWGTLDFTYYFNPTVNDRNLEFDLKRNLLGTKANEPGGIRLP